jgi:hypothetical protein
MGNSAIARSAVTHDRSPLAPAIPRLWESVRCREADPGVQMTPMGAKQPESALVVLRPLPTQSGLSDGGLIPNAKWRGVGKLGSPVFHPVKNTVQRY